ncbi:hypothetical protein [Streptomyces lydicus]|uniref:hypothetical protein n=1 Tax=Streptomyces lydicus TaxID=47763 RepID=UPI0028704270|nr:hypothetical protein [Streptomyces lydicus]
MSSDLQFSWSLTGAGWATYRITDGGAEHKSSPSYCTNALADLLVGVAGLYGPDATQRFSFDLEPSEVRWVLSSREAAVGIGIYRFPDMFKSFDLPDDDGHLLWSSEQSRTAFAHVVVEAAQDVLRLHGEGGYRKKWMQHPFPVAELRELRHLHLEQDTCDLPHELPHPE